MNIKEDPESSKEENLVNLERGMNGIVIVTGLTIAAVIYIAIKRYKDH